MKEISMNHVKSGGAWGAMVVVYSSENLQAALDVSIDIWCKEKRVAGRNFKIGDALRTEKFERVGDVEVWLSEHSGSASLKWGVLWSVIDQLTEANWKFGDFQIS